MESEKKNWKEEKALLDAELNARLRRVYRPSAPLVPGSLHKTFSGTVYKVSADGSFRKVKNG